MRTLLHLAGRFVTSVVALPPRRAERRWVADLLGPGELELWERQPRYDRRHTVRVARRVHAALAGREDRDDWTAAALLHDVGKVNSRLGLLGRVAATLAMLAAGRRRVASWDRRTGVRGRFGRYAAHGDIGARLIRDADGREAAARWAETHDKFGRSDSVDLRGLPEPVARALKLSDRT